MNRYYYPNPFYKYAANDKKEDDWSYIFMPQKSSQPSWSYLLKNRYIPSLTGSAIGGIIGLILGNKAVGPGVARKLSPVPTLASLGGWYTGGFLGTLYALSRLRKDLRRIESSKQDN